MASDSDQIQREIEATRADMAGALEQFGDRVGPSKVAARTKQKAADKVEEVKEKVSPVRVARRQGEKLKAGFHEFMGSEGRPATTSGGRMSMTDRASDVSGRARDTANNAGGALAELPHAARRSAENRPLAAGLLSFAAGFLLASVLPPTETERQMTERLKESLQPIQEEAKERGRQVAKQLTQSARQDVEEIKESATSAAQRVKSDAQDHADELKQHAQSAVEDVRDQATDAAQSVQDKAKAAANQNAGPPGGPQRPLRVSRRY